VDSFSAIQTLHTGLDHVYVNKDIVDSAVTSTTSIHYSDHFVVTLCFPFQLLY
jgi:endonuclease/exonuclease/phosphatase family metal-dependent hydrolase